MRHASRLAALALAGVALNACSSGATDDATGGTNTAASVDTAAVRQAIEDTNRRGSAAINAGDVAAWSAVYTDDAVVMWPNGPATRGKADNEAAATALLGQVGISNAAFTTENLMVFGDHALEVGTYSMTLTPKAGGSAMQDKGKYMTLWSRQADGSWKIARDINNSDLPAPSGS